MSTLSDQERAARAALKEAREQDASRAMADYEAEQKAIRAKTERLRALRLAKEAKEAKDAAVAAQAKQQKQLQRQNGKTAKAAAK